jgi:hypothetical protein
MAIDPQVQVLIAKIYELEQRLDDLGGGLQWVSFAPLVNSFSQGLDDNGVTDLCMYAFDSAGDIALRGTIVTPPSGGVIGIKFGQLPAGSVNQLSAFAANNVAGGSGGQVVLRQSGDLILDGNFVNSSSVRIYGRLILN